MGKSSAAIIYFGEEGSFSHLAAQRRFPGQELKSVSTVEQCFADLLGGKAGRIVVPIENASAGMITSTVDQLMALALAKHRKLAIREALDMKVELALLAQQERGPVRKIYSHLAPFNHARAWLQKHYAKAQQIVVTSTSEAARRAKKEKGTAAIAGLHTAELYRLKIVRRDVGGSVANQTTFLVIGMPMVSTSAISRTTIIFEVAHRPGALLEVLQALARHKLNLTKIESRPIPGRFGTYRFMIEFEGAPDQSRYAKAMAQIRKVTSFLATAGSYPVVKLK
jgi:chorismate mutase / prephenate dehydratase